MTVKDQGDRGDDDDDDDDFHESSSIPATYIQ